MRPSNTADQGIIVLVCFPFGLAVSPYSETTHFLPRELPALWDCQPSPTESRAPTVQYCLFFSSRRAPTTATTSSSPAIDNPYLFDSKDRNTQ